MKDLFKKYYKEEYSQISFYAVKTVLTIFILGIIVYYIATRAGSVLEFVSTVFKPLVLGIVLTYLLSPLVTKIEDKLSNAFKKHTTVRALSVVITLLIVIGAISLILAIIAVTVTKSFASFNIAGIKDYLIGLSEQFSKFWTTIETQLASMNINLGSLGDKLGAIFAGVKSGASTLLFAVIFAVYFLLDNGIKVYWSKVLDAFTTEETRTGLRKFAENADRVFSGYIRGQSTDALVVGILSAIALLIARVPYAVVIGILTGVGNLVPYVGPVVGFGSLIIVCLAEGSFASLLIGSIILALVMVIDSNVINPKLISSHVEVHPVLVIVALLAGGKIGGVVGMLVAVPAASLIKLQFDKLIEKRSQKA